MADSIDVTKMKANLKSVRPSITVVYYCLTWPYKFELTGNKFWQPGQNYPNFESGEKELPGFLLNTIFPNESLSQNPISCDLRPTLSTTI